MPSKIVRLQELDALRGIASMIVLLHHFTMFTPFAHYGFHLGVTGVDLFFMISAFVIFMTLDKINIKPLFIINRVSRMYPTYWACVTFTFVLIVAQVLWNNQSIEISLVGKYLVNMTMFQQYFNIENLDSPYWTMILEMSFYIGMYVLFLGNWHKYVIPIALVVIVILVSLTLWAPENALLSYLYRFLPFLAFLPLFLAGIIFYKIMFKEKKKYYLILLVFCLVVQVFMLEGSLREEHGVSTYENLAMLLIYFSLFGLFVVNKLQFIVNPITIFLGKISFPLYLIHQHISSQILFPFFETVERIGFWTSRVLVFMVVVFISYLIHVTVEAKSTRKMRNYLRKFFKIEPRQEKTFT